MPELANEERVEVADQGSVVFLTKGDVPEGDTSVLEAHSPLTGLSFRVTIPRIMIVRDAVNMRNTMIVIAISLLVVAAVLSRRIVFRLFRPVEELAALVSNHASNHRNELYRLREGIRDLYEKRLELERRRPLLIAACLEKWLTGNYESAEELHMMFLSLGLNVDFSVFRVALAPDKAWQDVESFFEGGTVYAFKAPEFDVLLLCSDSMEANSRLLSELSFRIRLVAGTLVSVFDHVGDSYRTARIALDYRPLTEDGWRTVRFDSDILSSRLIPITQDAEYRLANYIKNGLPDAALSLYDQLCTQCMAIPGMRYADLYRLYKDIDYLIIKTAPAGARCVPEKEMNDTTGESLKRKIRAICEINARNNPTKNNRMDAILVYVSENLYVSALSLELIAEKFKISTSLVSRIFTEQYGENFNRFINRLRVERAAQIFTQRPDEDIRSVAQRVGYENDVSFRRAFKQYMGMTPSAYRGHVHLVEANMILKNKELNGEENIVC
jgi:AraC-like DNA-binding protein